MKLLQCEVELRFQSKMNIINLFMYTIDNPESLSARLIYSYDRGTNIPWSIPQYKTPREYLDPLKQVQDRAFATQKKGQKNRKYVTKRGFYMDYDLKIAASIPGANKHGSNAPWSVQKLIQKSKNKKVDPKLIKRTYLDEIQIEQKNRKKPGICTYSLEKSQKQKDAEVQLLKKRKYFTGEKRFYHEDTTFIAGGAPGSGQYNPHDHVTKIRLNKTDHKFWIKKHKDQDEKSLKQELKLPAPGTYTPMNSTFTTFDLIQKERSNSKSKEKNNGFGTDARFQYTRPDKKKIKQKRPDPISYNTTYEWRVTKSISGSPKHRPWNQAISKGYATLSVYH